MSQTMSQTILDLSYYQLRNLCPFPSLQSPEFFPLVLWTYTDYNDRILPGRNGGIPGEME